VWIGVAFAWTGADANAERELTGVVEQHPNTEHGPNARFYLAQLALWGRRAGPAQRYLGQLKSVVAGLPRDPRHARAELAPAPHAPHAGVLHLRHPGAPRADGRLEPAAAAQDQRADQALQLLQQNPGACASR
jgi:hypothetical protein